MMPNVFKKGEPFLCGIMADPQSPAIEEKLTTCPTLFAHILKNVWNIDIMDLFKLSKSLSKYVWTYAE